MIMKRSLELIYLFNYSSGAVSPVTPAHPHGPEKDKSITFPLLRISTSFQMLITVRPHELKVSCLLEGEKKRKPYYIVKPSSLISLA